MSKQLIKKGIALVSVLIILVVSCALWFGSISNAWFKEFRTSYFTASRISSIVYGGSNNIASIKNLEDFDEEIQFEDLSGEFTERFIPGDVVYYTFIASIDTASINLSVDQIYTLEFLGMEAVTMGPEAVPGGEIDFVSNCVIEAGTLQIAVLKSTVSVDDPEDITYEIYHDSNPLNPINTDIFYNASNGPYDDGVYHIYTSVGGLAVEFPFTIPGGMDYPNSSDLADFLIIVPIWYQDTTLNQNDEMNCSLTIEGCSLTPGGTP